MGKQLCLALCEMIDPNKIKVMLRELQFRYTALANGTNVSPLLEPIESKVIKPQPHIE